MPEKNNYFHDLPRWLLLITWGSIILWFSLIPHPPVPQTGILGWDKFQHASSYGIFTLLAGAAFASFQVGFWHRWGLAVAVAIIFGALLEAAQGIFTTYRAAESGDLLADIIGAATVYIPVVMWHFHRRAKV